MKIITAGIIKGGAGKTATVCALAQAAAAAGKKVLAIDLDPQANLSFALGANQNHPGAYELLTGGRPRDSLQTTQQGISVICGAPNLATLTTTPGSAKRLRNALEPVKAGYDIAFVDVPPMLGELLYNALQASSDLLIPMETDTNNLQGLYQISDIARMMQRTNTELRIAGVLITRYDGRPKLNRYILGVIEDAAEKIGVPFLGTIRNGIAIRESMALQESLYTYAPKSNPAQDYLELYKTIMKE